MALNMGLKVGRVNKNGSMAGAFEVCKDNAVTQVNAIFSYTKKKRLSHALTTPYVII